ncbi:MAG: hypothetical protein DI536_07015 [Archangium gephyra]|uniref:DUF4870 domain-containing protein n=1 Tax=Archangium gephyra TaxID=48 RepID=A0A2W5TKD4_9BACT|nr:MAG: hypothetical protein DI536_07015 [Archangium gephyra]
MTPQDQQQQQIQSVGAEQVREQDKIQLVLAYFGIFALIPYLTVKDSEFVKYHAKQGLVLNVIGGVALTIISAIPFVNLLGCILWPALFVIDVLAIMKALKGERWNIPVVSDLATKF